MKKYNGDIVTRSNYRIKDSVLDLRTIRRATKLLYWVGFTGALKDAMRMLWLWIRT